MGPFKRTFGYIDGHPLAGRNRFAAYWRFFLWQLKSRLSTGFLVMPFIGNLKFYAKNGMTGITGNIYTGLHDFEEMSFLLHLLRKEDVFFDIGANVGSYTLLASGITGSSSICFEPVRGTFELLKANIAFNKLNHLVSLENTAAGIESGRIQFSSTHGPANHAVLPGSPAPGSEEVEMVSLDASYPGTIPLLMKIDVEGFELNVLKGANNLLSNPGLKAIIIELNGSGERYGHHDQDIHNLLRSAGFQPFWYEPYTRDLRVLNNYLDKNTIYVRDYDFVVQRIANAKCFTVLNTTI